jgi:hypothetical protein
MSQKVKNLNDTSESAPTCNCDSWLTHWEKFNNRVANACCVLGCRANTNLVGAHVQKEDSGDRGWYIIPLCKDHNNKRGQELVISDAIRLAPIARQLTCK